MLGLSSSCDATVRLTRKASIPEKPGDVKEFDKGKRWNAVLPGGKSLAARCVPLARCGLFVITRRCLFIPCNALCHCEAPFCGAVAISRKGHRIIKPTQDTFVLAWRKKAQTSKRVSIAAPTMRFQKRSLRLGLALFPFFRHILFLLWRRDFA